MNYYNFHLGDYIKHTVHLSNAEDLAYRRLLDLYYDTERPIPTDIPLVSRRLRVGIDELQSVLNEFFVMTDEGYKNMRADDEIAAYHAYLEKQRMNGKQGGRPKKTHRLPTDNPSQTQTEPKKSLTNTHKPNKEIYIPACPEGLSLDLWDKFLEHRKKIKKDVTDIVVKGIIREANTANWSLDEAITIMLENSWQSFRSDFVKNLSRPLLKETSRPAIKNPDEIVVYRGKEMTREEMKQLKAKAYAEGCGYTR